MLLFWAHFRLVLPDDVTALLRVLQCRMTSIRFLYRLLLSNMVAPNNGQGHRRSVHRLLSSCLLFVVLFIASKWRKKCICGVLTCGDAIYVGDNYCAINVCYIECQSKREQPTFQNDAQ